MVPKRSILASDIAMPVEEALLRVLESRFTRVPVYEGSLDRVIGILHTKELLSQLSHRQLLDGWNGKSLTCPSLSSFACAAP